MPNHDDSLKVFCALVRKAGFYSISAFQLCLEEISADYGPAYIMANTCSHRLGEAIAVTRKVLDVKKLFRVPAASEHPSEEICRRLEALLKGMEQLGKDVEPHTKDPAWTPARQPEGLATRLGIARLTLHTELLIECRKWSKAALQMLKV